jgi:ribosomal protein L40E
VLTPVFVLTVVWTWRAIVKSDEELPRARDVEIAQTPTENLAQPFSAVEETAVLDAYCPNCAASVSVSAAKCRQCGASFTLEGGWRPTATPPDIKEPSRLDLYSVGRLFVWAGHVSLVLTMLAISFGRTDGMLARFFLVMPFLYAAGFLLKYIYRPRRRSE